MRPRILFGKTVVMAMWLVTLVALDGCAMTQEERDFYGRGWLNPRELDRPTPYRDGRTPASERTTNGAPANPWVTPDYSPRDDDSRQ